MIKKNDLPKCEGCGKRIRGDPFVTADDVYLHQRCAKGAFKDLRQSESIAAEAERLVTGDRREAYGEVRESFAAVAASWSGILRSKVKPEQVCQCMIALKLHREANRPKRDNRVDIIGYALLAEKLMGGIAE